jgi:microcompartment protein CcmL/EutN
MAQLSLGLIETIGLVAAVEAADAAVKSANVKLVGYELTRGDGMATVKVLGEVGAVNAAISAARAAAARIGRVVSTRVIARPVAGLAELIANADTIGTAAPQAAPNLAPADSKARILPPALKPVEPVPVTVTAALPEPVPEPVAAALPEPVPEPVAAAVPEPVPEPVAAALPEPEPEPVAARLPAPAPEPQAKPKALPPKAAPPVRAPAPRKPIKGRKPSNNKK